VLPIGRDDENVYRDEDRYDPEHMFERRLDESPLLTRLSNVTSRRQEIKIQWKDIVIDVIELRCDVEYGPVFGRRENDLRENHVHEVLRRIIDAKPELCEGTTDSAVFNFERRAASPTDVFRTISTLEARADDMALSLLARSDLSHTVTLLRQQFAAVL
jgi:hypothetical protein